MTALSRATPRTRAGGASTEVYTGQIAQQIMNCSLNFEKKNRALFTCLMRSGG